MKKIMCSVFLVIIFLATMPSAGLLDDLFKNISKPLTSSTKKAPDNDTVVSGLKEALSIGTLNAVMNVSQLDGYFKNELIKILVPEKIRTVADVLQKAGFQKQVDEFELSMNRAAEAAAPEAKQFFIDAIKEMTFEDAKHILNGGDTAATDFFKRKTSEKLYIAFKPVISTKIDEVGVTKAYKDMMGKFETIPFVQKEAVDLDHYVTSKALEGLFYMVGQEEIKIRKDPAARVTELLKTVFSK